MDSTENAPEDSAVDPALDPAAVDQSDIAAASEDDDEEEWTDCPVCAINGYRHRPGCRNTRYLASILTNLADRLDRPETQIDSQRGPAVLRDVARQLREDFTGTQSPGGGA